MKKSLALLVALASFSCAAPVPPRPAPVAPAPPAPQAVVDFPVVDRPRLELIKKLDEMIQGRFSTVTPEDIRTRRLGFNRMQPTEQFHLKDLSAATPASEGWATAVYVVRERGEEKSRGRVLGPVSARGEAWTSIEDRRAVEELAHRAMIAKGPVAGGSHGIPLEARMVPASAPICQRCHAGKEIGDPVGAVVYAFHRERPPVATSGR